MRAVRARVAGERLSEQHLEPLEIVAQKADRLTQLARRHVVEPAETARIEKARPPVRQEHLELAHRLRQAAAPAAAVPRALLRDLGPEARDRPPLGLGGAEEQLLLRRFQRENLLQVAQRK